MWASIASCRRLIPQAFNISSMRSVVVTDITSGNSISCLERNFNNVADKKRKLVYNKHVDPISFGGDTMNVNTVKLEALLAERGMTKSTLAERSGICRQNISAIIRRGTCELRTAGKLAAALQL